MEKEKILQSEINTYLSQKASEKYITPEEAEKFLYRKIEEIYGFDKEEVKRRRALNPIWWSYITPFYHAKAGNNGNDSESMISGYEKDVAEKLWKKYREDFLKRVHK